MNGVDTRRWTVEFGEDGTVTDPTSIPTAAALAELTDVFVFSHGWNNAPAAARDLAADLFGRVHRLLDPGVEPTTGFLTVVWPSMLLPDDVPVAAAAGTGDVLVEALRTAFSGRATFSHFAFCADPPEPTAPGALAGMVDRVHGPSVSTFSEHDRACGWWYPAASLLARQDASEVGDPLFRWGALGHDGYQGGDVVDMRTAAPGTPYGIPAGRLTRVDAGDVVARNLSWMSGAHGDIRHDEIAWLVVDAASAGKRG